MITYRNMWVQVLLAIVTLGLFSIYWFHVTNREMNGHLGRNESIGVLTILYIIPIANLFAYWKQGVFLSDTTNDRYPAPLLFVLWIIFSPASWFITQYELNKIATSAASGGTDVSSPGAPPYVD